jgi:hypothetical protein
LIAVEKHIYKKNKNKYLNAPMKKLLVVLCSCDRPWGGGTYPQENEINTSVLPPVGCVFPKLENEFSESSTL